MSEKSSQRENTMVGAADIERRMRGGREIFISPLRYSNLGYQKNMFSTALWSLSKDIRALVSVTNLWAAFRFLLI